MARIIIAEPRLNAAFKHCGSFERCPEKVTKSAWSGATKPRNAYREARGFEAV